MRHFKEYIAAVILGLLLVQLLPLPIALAEPDATPAPTDTPAPEATILPAPTDSAAPEATDEPTTDEPIYLPEETQTGIVKKGMQCDEVILLQMRLRDLGYYNYKITNYFGSYTEDAVKGFQKENELSVDGVMGPKTFDILFSNDAKRAPVKEVIKPTPTPLKLPGQVKSVPKGKLMTWDKGRNLFPRGTSTAVIDVYTRVQYAMTRVGGSKHFDVEPSTKADCARRWALAHLELPEVARWTSETPELYTLEVTLASGGEVVVSPDSASVTWPCTAKRRPSGAPYEIAGQTIRINSRIKRLRLLLTIIPFKYHKDTSNHPLGSPEVVNHIAFHIQLDALRSSTYY